MAASYQTGTASDNTDLYNKLLAWLQVQGWTLNLSTSVGTGMRGHLSKAGVYVNLRLSNNESPFFQQSGAFTGFGLYTGTGFDSAKAWNAQAGGALQSGSSTNVVCVSAQLPTIPIVAYHFFDDGSNNIAIVIERASGIFVHIGWGSVKKAGSWTGGSYYFGSRDAYYSSATTGAGTGAQSANVPADSTWALATCYVRADVDAYTGKWLSLNTATGTGGCGKDVYSSFTNHQEVPNYINNFNAYQTNAADGQANLLPIRLYVARDAGGYSLIGDLPNLFQANAVGSGYAAGTVYSLGTDNYMLFPNFAVKKFA